MHSKVLSTLDINSFSLVEVPLNLAGRGRFQGSFLLVVSVAMGEGGGRALVGASRGPNKRLRYRPLVLCLFGEGGKSSTIDAETSCIFLLKVWTLLDRVSVASLLISQDSTRSYCSCLLVLTVQSCNFPKSVFIMSKSVLAALMIFWVSSLSLEVRASH